MIWNTSKGCKKYVLGNNFVECDINDKNVLRLNNFVECDISLKNFVEFVVRICLNI